MTSRAIVTNSTKVGLYRAASRIPSTSRASSTSSNDNTNQPPKDDTIATDKVIEDKAVEAQATQKTTKTAAQADEELRSKMAGISGDGGDAGIEYEDGQPVAMKRSVKNNMFRYI